MSRYTCDPKDFAGNFIREAAPTFRPRSVKNKEYLTKERMVELQCLHCHRCFIISLVNAKRTKQQCCSRSCYREMTETFPGGNEKHPMYSRWLSTVQRCFNPNSVNYHNYGGRGIGMQKELRESFPAYVAYVLGLPDAPTSFPTQLQLDRIDNDKGYQKGNLRWTTQAVNCANVRMKSRKYAGNFIGVTWVPRIQKWTVRLRAFKQVFFIGNYVSELEAAKARNEFIIANNLPNKLNSI